METEEEPKEEVNVKVEVPDLCIDDNKRNLYEEIVQLVQTSKLTSSKAFSTAQESSYMLFPGQDEPDPGKLYQNFSSPLMTAVESLDVTLAVLKSMEVDICGGLSGLFIESRVPSSPGLKKENSLEEFDEFDDCYNDDPDIENDDPLDLDFENVKLKQRKQKSSKKKGLHSCDECDYTTNIARYLTHHKKVHAPAKYKCELCSFNRNKPLEMKLHMKRSHKYERVEYLCDRLNSDLKYFLCQLCSYLNTDPDTLEQHCKEKHSSEDHDQKEESDSLQEAQYSNGVGNSDDIKSEIKKEKEEGFTQNYSCDKCPYTTTNIKYYEDHIQGIFAYKKCPFCPKEFKAQRGRMFSSHIKNVHKCITPDGLFKCNICDKQFTKISKFEFHLSKDHNMGVKFHCPKCDYSTEKKSLYHLHIVEHDNAELPCPHCTFLAKSALRLEKHIYTVHTSRRCKLCHINFEMQSQLNQHNRDVHGQIEICDECGYEGTSKMNLRWHKQQKHEEKTISCDQCGFMTTTQGLLNLHIKVKHLKYYEKKDVDFFCDQCDYSTKSRTNLKQHVNSQHLKIRFSCDMCDTTFTSQISLQRHKKSKHTGTSEKIRCEEKNCEYTTSCKDNLKCHVEKVHQGIRWPCEQCQYVGGYKGDLTRHMKVVHHGFTLKCQLCDYTTPKKYYLKGHMLKAHGIANESIGDTKLF